MSFLRSVAIKATDAAGHGDLLGQLRRDAIQAIVIEDVYTAAECAAIVADLESNRHGFPKTFFPGPFKSSFLGVNLNLADPDLAAYFAAGPRFERALRALLPPPLDLAGRIFTLFGRLDGGRAYRAPAGPSADTAYMPTTFRVHEDGGYIPAHFDNEQTVRPSFRHLAAMIRGDVLSFVLTLARAEHGGVLEVFDVRAREAAGQFRNRDGRAKPDLSATAKVAFDVPAGTIVLLRSGDRLHRVSPVAGPTRRWTACSFMAEANAGEAVYCWG